jgi:riboflavin kinase/FMN adenylyltransferase
MKKVSLILGFFDGVHAGHQNVINSVLQFQDTTPILLTFKRSPAEFFGSEFNYIYPREESYKLIKEMGVREIIEQDFAQLQKETALEYLQSIVAKFQPKYISTGFNHTFGFQRVGNPSFLREFQPKFNYEYLCANSCQINGVVVSSTSIKNRINLGDLSSANKFLTRNFSITSTVIEGEKLGRQIGFPTANLVYPNSIVKLPHGVYKVQLLNRVGVLNWGIKPTVNSKNELLEVHIPNFNENLYGQKLKIEFIEKIRDEKKFENIEELKSQIQKDVEYCLK